MKTTPVNTIAGLATYFLDDVLDAHRSSYPVNMTLTQFDEELDAYRDGMNHHNSCKFPGPSRRSIAAMFNAYQAATAARA